MDAEKIVSDLRDFRSRIYQFDSDDNAVIEAAVAIIEAQTRPLTLKDAVSLMNERGWRGCSDYIVVEGTHHHPTTGFATASFVQSERGSKAYTEFEAIYIAQGIEREKGGASDGR